MKGYARFITNHSTLIIVIAIFLLVPSLYGMAVTRINYDILTYLPSDLESMKGQEILDKTFSNAATGMLIIENMEAKDVLKVKDKISGIEGVDKVIWISDLLDTSIPKEILPDEVKSIFYSDNSTLLLIKFNQSASSDITQRAVTQIRKVMGKQSFLSGTAALINDTKHLADTEAPLYILLAIIFSVIILSLTMQSVLIPFIFLASIGMAVLYNLGTNTFLGQISYVTKSIAAVLQLGVTMDYSIFLLHRYDEERNKGKDKKEAMVEAITKTISSITGSSLTTIAGFLALITMRLSLGKDIGLVMAKGVLLGIITAITILPALILVFDQLIHRFSHKPILPDFSALSSAVSRHYKLIVLIFVIAFIPAVYGQSRTAVYYNLDESLPKDLPSVVALNKLKNQYNMVTTHFVIVDSNIPRYKLAEMENKLEQIDGIQQVIGYDKFLGERIPDDFIPQELRENFEQGHYKLIMINSQYKSATDEEEKQLNAINEIVKQYDPSGMLTGEGALTSDLVKIADQDFKNVNIASSAAIFAIVAAVFASFSIPVILVLAIELAIFINMAIPFYIGISIPFIASIIIGTIQLGATVDYAILMTNRFKEEIQNGYDKHQAVMIAIRETTKSIVTSALTFFAATAGVGIIAKIEIIKSICSMLARGALISMVVILFILPSLLQVFEGIIARTTFKWKKLESKMPNLQATYIK